MTGSEWRHDLLLVAIVTVVAALAIVHPTTPEPIIWVLGIPFLVFIPGYVVIAALFPERVTDAGGGGIFTSAGNQSSDFDSDGRQGTSPGWIPRIGLSLVLSPVVVAVVGVFLSPFAAIQLVPVVAGLTLVILVFTCLAWFQRRQLAPKDRAAPLAPGRVRVLTSMSAGSRLQNAVMVIALLVLVASISLAVAYPNEGEAYTEAYLLSEEGMADDYPTEFVAGETDLIQIGIENHENQAMTYEVVTVLQVVDESGDVTEQSELDRFEVELADEAGTIEPREFAPDLTGESLRLQVLIHEGAAPDTVDRESADYGLHIWVTVEESDSV